MILTVMACWYINGWRDKSEDNLGYLFEMTLGDEVKGV